MISLKFFWPKIEQNFPKKKKRESQISIHGSRRDPKTYIRMLKVFFAFHILWIAKKLAKSAYWWSPTRLHCKIENQNTGPKTLKKKKKKSTENQGFPHWERTRGVFPGDLFHWLYRALNPPTGGAGSTLLGVSCPVRFRGGGGVKTPSPMHFMYYYPSLSMKILGFGMVLAMDKCTLWEFRIHAFFNVLQIDLQLELDMGKCGE